MRAAESHYHCIECEQSVTSPSWFFWCFMRILLRLAESLVPWSHRTPPTPVFLHQPLPDSHSTWPGSTCQQSLESHRLPTPTSLILYLQCVLGSKITTKGTTNLEATTLAAISAMEVWNTAHSDSVSPVFMQWGICQMFPVHHHYMCGYTKSVI